MREREREIRSLKSNTRIRRKTRQFSWINRVPFPPPSLFLLRHSASVFLVPRNLFLESLTVTHTFDVRIVSLTCFGHWTGVRDLVCHIIVLYWYPTTRYKNLPLIFPFSQPQICSTALCNLTATVHLSLNKWRGI